jgi:DNA-binding NtrC family response regulator
MVAAGTFRHDLYERLAGLILQTPPLRERLVDLPELAQALLGRMRGDGEGKVLSPGALTRLAEHDWKGNVRELSNVLQRAAIHTLGIEIPASAIALAGSRLTSRESTPAADSMASEEGRRLLIERNLCQQALDEANGSIRQAARNLDKSISSFRRRLVQLGIRPSPESSAHQSAEASA